MNEISKITVWGMALNVVLTALKFVAGFLFHSQACIADAVHSLSDFLTDIAVLVGVRFWSAPADQDHPHGHQRIEALTTLFIGTLLAFTAIRIGTDAIYSIGPGMDGAGAETRSLPGWPVFWIAIISIVVKEFLYQWTALVGRRCHSSAVIANAWHHRSDALSSIPVAIAALASRIWPNLTYLDSIAAILVSCMLLHTAWQIAWPRLKELSDVGATHLEQEQMLQIASSIPGVKEVHELRTRRLGDSILLDLHILVDRNMSVEDGHRICEEAAAAIQKRMPAVLDVLTHLEPFEPLNLEEGIATLARKIPGVKDLHHIRVRKVLAGYDADLHILVDGSLSVAQGHDICRQVKQAILASPLHVVDVLTHLEPVENPKA